MCKILRTVPGTGRCYRTMIINTVIIVRWWPPSPAMSEDSPLTGGVGGVPGEGEQQVPPALPCSGSSGPLDLSCRRGTRSPGHAGERAPPARPLWVFPSIPGYRLLVVLMLMLMLGQAGCGFQ